MCFPPSRENAVEFVRDECKTIKELLCPVRAHHQNDERAWIVRLPTPRIAMRIIIIGGGIGGLTASLALRRVGCAVTVFEQSPVLREAGAGITLWPNATRVLHELGLTDAVRAAAAPITRGQICNRFGRVLADIRLDSVARRTGGEILGIHRADLLAVLARSVDPADIRLGARLMDLTVDENGVTARFANGETARGDLLVGADGIHSRVRELTLGDPRRYCGYVGWRGVARLDLPPGLSTWSYGQGAQFGLIPIGGGRVFWFGTGSMPEEAIPHLGSPRDELLARFGKWHAPIPELVASLHDDEIVRTPIYDRPPAPRWGDGRVTLLGDSAHATTPTLGQGACLAIESAYVLAEGQRRGAKPAGGMDWYQRRRRPRTGRVIRLSWQIGRAIQWRYRALCWLRDRAIGMTPTFLHQHALESIITAGCVAPAYVGVPT